MGLFDYGLAGMGYNLSKGRDLFGGSRDRSSRDPNTPKGYDRFSTLDPQQQQIYQMLTQMLGSGGNFQQAQDYQSQLLSGDPAAYEKFEAPYKRQFNEQIVPGLAERFSGMGAGAQSSSAFQQALGGAGADLSERIASMREGLRYQASSQPFEQLMRLLGLETQGLVKKKGSWWEELLSGLAPGLGQAGGNAAIGAAAKYLPLMF